MIPPNLLDKNCSLIPYSSDHDKQTVDWLNDPHIKDTFGLTYNVDIKSHRQWVDSQDNLMIWAINWSKVHVGNVSLRINERHKKAYFEIYIGSTKSRGKGVGRQALSLILKFAFMTLKLNRVYLYTRLDNDIANALYLNSGFKLEGTERESIFNLNDEPCDQMLWSLLRSEYKGG